MVETAKCFAPYALMQFAALPALGFAIGGAPLAQGVLLTSVGRCRLTLSNPH